MTNSAGKALLILENSYIPMDTRVTSEALTLRDAGWEVVVICPDFGESGYKREKKRPPMPEGIRVITFPINLAQRGVISYFAEYVSAFFSIARLAGKVWREKPFDVMHLANPPDIFFPIAWVYRLRGTRIIFDHHDLFPELVQWRYTGIIGKLFYLFARIAELMTYRVANIVIATNESYRRIALERGHKKEEDIVVVRNGPRLHEFVPVSPDPELKKGASYLVGYAGVMGYDDGVLELIPAIEHVINNLRRTDIRFALLGDGPVYEQACKQLATLNLSPYVDMPGMVYDRTLLRRYLCTAEILLAPETPTPLNQRSTFIKIGEYMAMGRPIVSYDLPETRYTAEEAAVYVENENPQAFGQAVVDLLDSPEKRQAMAEVGRHRVNTELAWEHQQANLLKAYNRLIGANQLSPIPKT
jgi:glycosyltransferase involved in cell wall biosynthesis